MENKYQLQDILKRWDRLSNQTVRVENHDYKTDVIVVGNFTFFFTNKKYLEVAKKAIETGNKYLILDFLPNLRMPYPIK
tara:strand:- start:1942 stop:2178 length:237 start_codon:yes stop_codon:yes gene_type:complete